MNKAYPPLCMDYFARVIDIQRPTPDVRVLTIVPFKKRKISFKAGQYMALGFNDLPARPFSIANAPDGCELTFHIKDSRQEGVSSYIAQNLNVGDNVRMEGPFGEAFYRGGAERPILAIAGGMGIAPVKAIIEQALRDDHPTPVTLYWGANVEKDLYMRAHFEDLEKKYDKFTFIPIVKNPVGECVEQNYEDFSVFDIYMAGPPPMTKSVSSSLMLKGARRDRVFFDSWNAPGSPIPDSPEQPREHVS